MVATRFLKGRCVYWAPAPPTEQGQQGFLPPVEIPCRWTDQAQAIVVKSGEAVVTVASTAWVMVDRDLEEQGVLLRAKLSQVTDKTDPFNNLVNNRRAFQIQRFVSIDDVSGENPVRKAFL